MDFSASEPSVFGWYKLVVHDANSNNTWCGNQGTSCGGELPNGDYYATVEGPDGNVYGQSDTYELSDAGVTDLVNDDVDLGVLSTLLAGDICDPLVFYSGTHLMELPSSESDQLRVCQTGEGEGKGGIALLTAVAATTGGVAALHWLEAHGSHIEVTDDGNGGTTTAIPTYPDSPPVPLKPRVERLAKTIEADNPGLTWQQEKNAAMACMYDMEAAGKNGFHLCQSLPVFLPGYDVRQAARHDLEAIAAWPDWAELQYVPAANKPGPRTWYQSQPECAGVVANVTSCDEYPFYSSDQGGGTSTPQPSLEVIDAGQNSLEGSKYSGFLSSCGITSGDAFIVAPVLPYIPLDTYKICNPRQ